MCTYRVGMEKLKTTDLYIQARSNLPNSTPHFENSGFIEYSDGHDAGFYFIGYRECTL